MLLVLLITVLIPNENAVRGNPSTWITGTDYPSDLLRTGVQGDVSIALEVNSNGSPARCIVEQSSGSPRLDIWTCDLMMQRATFDPVGSTTLMRVYRRKVAWRIPVDDPSKCSFRDNTVPLLMTADSNRD